MADEVLRMQAEVQDRFSGPLKALRAALLDTSRQGAAHGEALAKGLNRAEAAAQATARTATTVLNPALAAIGVTGLGAGVAVSGVISALNSLGSNLSGLGALSRETGMAADQLRIFQSVAGKFGISSDASSAAAKTFSENMRDIRRGAGEISSFLQSQNTVIAQYYQKLRGTKDNDQANKIAEDMLEHVPNPVDRARLAARIYGNADLGRIGDGSRGPIADLNRATEQKFGPLPKGAVESAERYERAIADLRSSMQRVGDSIAIELLGPAEKFTSWVDQVVAGKRGDFTQGLREGIRGIKTELEAINWKQFGDDSLAALRETTALVGSMAKGFHDIAEAIHSLREGKYADALARADSASGPVLPGKEAGADGPLRRRLAPRVGDDEIAAKQNVDDLRRLLDASKEAGDHVIGRAQQRMGLIEAPEAVQKRLQAAESELARLQSRTPEQRQKDFDASTERLRKSVDGLSEQLKQQQNGKDATAQKSSLDADELFGGARVQAASLGGASVFGGPGGNRAEMRERFRQYLMRKVPGYDGGATVPTGPEGRIPGVDGGTPRMPGIGGGSPMPSIGGGSGSIVTHGHRWTPGARTAEGKARVQSWLDFMQRPVDQGGVGADAATARAMVGTMQGESGADLNPKAVGTVGEIGTAQWYKERANALRSKAAGMGVPWYDVGAQQQHFRDEVIHGRYRGVWQQMLRAKSEDEKMWIAIDQFESPKYKKKAFDFRLPNLRRLQQDAASGRMPGMQRPDVGQADGEGWASREKARKAFEAMQKGEGRLDASAARAGVVTGPKIENNGSVSVVVQRPGPDTNVRTSASGNLFKDVVLSRGRTMAPAGSS